MEERKIEYQNHLSINSVTHKFKGTISWEKALEHNDISGYSYNRPGIKNIIELVDSGELDVLVVKDLSRIGRHNAKTLLFMEDIEDKGVKVLLTSGNNDENFRGIQTWFNELYVKDIARKRKLLSELNRKTERLMSRILDI